jgi:hypothetical protein
VNSLGSVFTLLNMQSVRPASSVDWTNAVKLRLLTFSGVEILADLVAEGDEYLLRLHASHPAASVAEDTEKQVEDINRKVEGWAYGIPQQKFENMVKKPEDLLKPPASS